MTEREARDGKYRDRLPQLTGELFLTDGGAETTLIFHEGLELPYFAAFDLLKNAAGQAALRNYFRTYAEIAQKYSVGFILESATWRASSDWGAKLGYSTDALAAANRQAIAILRDIRDEFDKRADTDGDQRLHRTARRRLQSGEFHERSRGGKLSPDANADF